MRDLRASLCLILAEASVCPEAANERLGTASYRAMLQALTEIENAFDVSFTVEELACIYDLEDLENMLLSKLSPRDNSTEVPSRQTYIEKEYAFDPRENIGEVDEDGYTL
jgi:hypothetical protein